MKKTITIMTTEECFSIFQSENLKVQYSEQLANVDITDIYSIQHFLDTEAYDIKRLTPSQCELLDLAYEEGYYISTWNMEYLEN